MLKRNGLTSYLVIAFSFLIATSAFASDKELSEVQDQIVKTKGRWKAGKNKISELADRERKNRLGAAPLKGDLMSPASATPSTLSGAVTSTSVPATLDWRNMNGMNYVTPIRDQGNCGSCWAFAATAALESQIAIANGGLKSDNSEQVGLSCANAGTCNGGYASVMSNFIATTGLPSESYFPYSATDQTCSNAATGWVNYTDKIVRYTNVQTGNISALQTAISTYGPVIVRLAVYNDFYYYSSGIYRYSGGAFAGYHYMTVVGYDNVAQYFIAKNSWGTWWGEAGYVRVGYENMTNAVGFGASENIAYYSSNAPPSLSLTSPAGGAVLTAGSRVSVQWMYSGSPCSTVTLNLLNDDVLSSVISSSVSIGSGGAGSYSWTIPSTQPVGSNYKVQIACVANPNFSSTSGAFAINGLPAAPSAPYDLTAALSSTSTKRGKKVTVTTVVKLAWNSIATGVTFSVYRNGILLANVSTKTFEDKNTSTGTSYTYTVKATDSYGQSSQLSAPVTVTR